MNLRDAFAGMKEAQEPERLSTQAPKHLSAQEPESLGTQEPKSLGPQAPKHPGTQAPKTLGTQAPRSLGAQVPKHLPPLPLQKTGKSSHPDYEAVKVYVRRQTRKDAWRKWEDAQGGDFSDLMQHLLEQYVGA